MNLEKIADIAIQIRLVVYGSQSDGMKKEQILEKIADMRNECE